MFLLYDLYKASKLIKEKEKRLELDQYTKKERTIKNYKKVSKEELKKYNEFLINVKKELEDKEKLTREDINKLTDKILKKDVVNI